MTKIGTVQSELRLALEVAERQPPGAIYVVPVRLMACELPATLERYHCVDLFNSDGYQKLERTLKAVASRAPTTGESKPAPEDRVRRSIAKSQQALELCREIGEQRGEGEALLQLADDYQELGELRSAIHSGREAIHVFCASGYRAGEADAHFNLGHLLIDIGGFRVAKASFETALEIHTELSDTEMQLDAPHHVGQHVVKSSNSTPKGFATSTPPYRWPEVSNSSSKRRTSCSTAPYH